MKPSIGRIVHFVFNGHNAAIITAVNPDGTVDLHVFGAFDQPLFWRVTEDPSGQVHGTWHWPERE